MPIGHTGRVDLPLAVRSVQRKGRRCRPNYSTTCRLFEPGCRDVFSRCLLYILYLSIAYRDCEVSIAGEDLAVATRTRARGGAAAARGARAGRRRAAAALAVAARATRRAGKKYDIYISKSHSSPHAAPHTSQRHGPSRAPHAARLTFARLVNRRRRARLRAASSRPRSRVLPCGGGGSLGLGLGWRRGKLAVDVVSAALQREEEGRGQVWRAKGVVATGSPYHGYAC